jgi:predicted Zn-dependent peptidase
VNRADVSPFVQAIASSDFPPITPVYIDYEKDILRSTLPSGIELMMVPNSENDLFRLYYVFDMGSDNDKVLPFAMDYLNYLGAGDMTSEDISRKFFALGVTWGVNVGRDRTTLSLSGPNESFEPALALFEKLLATAKPNEEALEGIKAMTLK